MAQSARSRELEVARLVCVFQFSRTLHRRRSATVQAHANNVCGLAMLQNIVSPLDFLTHVGQRNGHNNPPRDARRFESSTRHSWQRMDASRTGVGSQLLRRNEESISPFNYAPEWSGALRMGIIPRRADVIRQNEKEGPPCGHSSDLFLVINSANST